MQAGVKQQENNLRAGGTGVIARGSSKPREQPLRQAVDDLTIYRRNLPHWRLTHSIYWITWRLHNQHDTLPIEARNLVVDVLTYASDRFNHYAYVVMDDHVHVLTQLAEGEKLQDLVQVWKSASAHKINQQQGWDGPVWMDEYFDRIVRTEEEFYEKCEYVLNNPRKRWPDQFGYKWVFCSMLTEEGLAVSQGITGDDARATGSEDLASHGSTGCAKDQVQG